MTPRRWLTLALLVLCSWPLHAQQGNAVIIPFVGVPTGSCSVIMLGLNTTNGDLYSCNGGSWVKVGGAGGGGTVTNTGGALTANAVVLGAGGNDTKVSTGITTNGASELDVGVAAGATGVLGLNGSTSGKVSATSSATATTLTITGVTPFDVTLGTAGTVAANLTLMSSVSSGGSMIGTGSGTTSANALGIWPGITTPAGNPPIILQNSTNGNGAAGLSVTSTSAYGWDASNATANNAYDTTLCRNAAGVVEAGTSACNSSGRFIALRHDTDTNCAATGTAANPSVASCGSSAAGSFSCATNASTGTCVVNTTSVTANSEIFIEGRNDATTGTRLGVTCNTGITTALPEIAAVVAATSFTINLGTFTTNPECFSYYIVN